MSHQNVLVKLFLQRWFLISLVLVIMAGMVTGYQLESDQLQMLIKYSKPRAITAFVLFLMSFSLDSSQFGKALRSPAPVLWSSFVNFGILPFIAWQMMSLQGTEDFKYGLFIACTVPCTMAAASVWTRKAEGNDAVSLLVTVLTNGLCFVITPFWLKLVIEQGMELESSAMVQRLVIAVLIPTIIGQLIRFVPVCRSFATRRKRQLSNTGQICILFIVFSAACKGGFQIREVGQPASVSSIIIVVFSCLFIHLLSMFIAVKGSKIFRFSREDQIASAFAGSQKTLPIAVLIATDAGMFGDPNLLGEGIGIPFAIMPPLIFHTTQLFIDTIIADRFAAKQLQLSKEPSS